MSFNHLQQYLSQIQTAFPASLDKGAVFVQIGSSNVSKGQQVSCPLEVIISFINLILPYTNLLTPYAKYHEKNWRAINKGLDPATDQPWAMPKFDGKLATFLGSQTKPFFTTVVKIVRCANALPYSDDLPLPLGQQELENTINYLTAILQGSGAQSLIATNQNPARNIIIYGAPGTGKSYRLNALGNSTRCVFHSDYLNSDFIGTYKPIQNGDSIQYRFSSGPFIKAFINAVKNPDLHFNLIIEELNRGNAGSIFGELIQLLDRDINGRSEYQICVSEELDLFLKAELAGAWEGELYLPQNLSLYATMNSADQGVMPLDSAFKRRWEFEFIPIMFDPSIPAMVEEYLVIETKNYSWLQLGESINKLLSDNGFDEDRLIGPRFLSTSEIANQAAFKNALGKKLFIYLWDDVLRHGKRELIFSEEFKSFSSLQSAFMADDNVFSSGLLHVLRRYHATA